MSESRFMLVRRQTIHTSRDKALFLPSLSQNTHNVSRVDDLITCSFATLHTGRGGALTFPSAAPAAPQ